MSSNPLNDEFSRIAELFMKLDPCKDVYFLDVMRKAFYAGAMAARLIIMKGQEDAMNAEIDRHLDNELPPWTYKDIIN